MPFEDVSFLGLKPVFARFIVNTTHQLASNFLYVIIRKEEVQTLENYVAKNVVILPSENCFQQVILVFFLSGQ